jgi:hypothetical protein
MWELQLADFFHIYLPALIFAIISAVSLLHFYKTKKKGYLPVSIGFVLLTVGWVALPTVVPYIYAFYLDRATPMIATGFGLLYFSYAVFCVIPALLILIGFMFLFKEPNAKTPQVASTPP